MLTTRERPYPSTMTRAKIRLLEPDHQRRGDLFGRLMSDLFHALGYHEVVLNIPKAGRELDLRASHRTGNHRVLAECKATADKTGGSDINKFVGALDVERRRMKSTTIDGYFISLNGFSPSALEQEDEAHRIILLTGEQVASELIAGHLVASPTTATAAASRCLTQNNPLTLNPELELWAHDSGWYWRVLFSRESSAEAFALVHADGTLLGQAATEPIVATDRILGGDLHKLALVAADGYHDAEREAAKLALHAYQAFLAHDYGHLTVDGLPADEHLGSRSIALEDLFVPMHLQAIRSRDPGATYPDEPQQDTIDLEYALLWNDSISDESASQREALGNVLRVSHRIAVLGPPGSGKSTLLRRLAVAYGVPIRLTEIDDNLPRRNWIPFVVRCRQLDELAGQPIHKVLESIPAKAEMPQHAAGFRTLMNSALHEGTALVLVDGLDEIIDPQLRMTFVKQLRTFVGIYPNVRLIVTSRESGFRLIAGALSDVCTRYRVAGFDDDDIKRLTEAWSALVLGNSSTTKREAVKLADTIVTTDRVRRLAQNPLLLTTLLLVRRWVGDLPKKRTALYDKAIEVLLMTWNVEAHSPIDLDMALPQLAYVAFAMTRARSQTLSRKTLIGLLENARKEMPEVLAYTEESPSQFIERIEERSSLLSLGGHTEEEGVVTPLYEFKHLTFQEYLAALAIVHNYYPGSKPRSTPVSVIKSLLVEPQWLEIIPMTAVLAGRRAATIVEAIIDALDREEDPHYSEILAIVLARCLADEVLIPPKLVEKSADAMAQHYPYLSYASAKHIAESKHGTIFWEAVTRGFFTLEEGWSHYGGLLSMICIHNALARRDQGNGDEWHAVLGEILDENDGAEAWGWCCLTAMELAYSSREDAKGVRLEPKTLYQIEKLVRPALEMDHPAVRYAAAWAYAWLSTHPLDARRYVGSVAPVIYRLWKNSQGDEMKSMMAWAFASLPLLPATANPLEQLDRDDEDFLKGEVRIESKGRDDRRPAALIAGYYQRAPWSQMELRHMTEELSRHWPTRARLLRRLR
jgi:hypothetical protein